VRPETGSSPPDSDVIPTAAAVPGEGGSIDRVSGSSINYQHRLKKLLEVLSWCP